MRVGLVVPGFSADANDWCIPALRHLARALAATDEVRVIAVRYPYRAARYALDDVEVIALGGAVRHGVATFDVWRRTLAALRAEHRRRPFDVLHAFWATESGLLTAVAGRLLGIPTLVSLAGGELVRLPEIGYGDQRVAWERLKIRASLGLASMVSAGSHQLVDLALGFVPGQTRVEYAPLGVDLELFNPSAAGLPAQTEPRRPEELRPADGPRLLQVGTLTAVKDQVTLLRAFTFLHAQSACATLDIVGDGPLRPALGQLAAELGIAEAVRFVGNVDHAVLPAVYRAATAFVVSSRHEAQGMVAIEAAACGTPVVGTCVGILPELTAAIAPVGQPEALAAAFTQHGEPDEARGVAEAHFGLETCTARFRALYATLTAA